MRLEHQAAAELKKKLLEIFGKHLDLNKYKVFFFGSRVTGGGDEHSDIDIGIEGPESIPVLTMSEIEDEIENLLTLYKIEIVDFKKASSDFYEVAKQGVELIAK